MKFRAAILSSLVVILGVVVLTLVPGRTVESSPATSISAAVPKMPTPKAGGMKRLVSSDDRRTNPNETESGERAPRGDCAQLQAHVDGLVAQALPRGKRSEHTAQVAKRGDAFLDLCHGRPMPEDMKQCFSKARSLDGLMSCGIEVLPPKQKAVHAKLLEQLESGALGSSDPDVVLKAVSESLDLDEQTTAEIAQKLREHREKRR